MCEGGLLKTMEVQVSLRLRSRSRSRLGSIQGLRKHWRGQVQCEERKKKEREKNCRRKELLRQLRHSRALAEINELRRTRGLQL